MNTNVIWIFKNGNSQQPCTSFPYAFRYLYNTFRKGVEAGLDAETLKQSLSIISPFKKIYTFEKASELASQQGLLNAQGELDKKAMKFD